MASKDRQIASVIMKTVLDYWRKQPSPHRRIPRWVAWIALLVIMVALYALDFRYSAVRTHVETGIRHTQIGGIESSCLSLYFHFWYFSYPENAPPYVYWHYDLPTKNGIVGGIRLDSMYHGIQTIVPIRYYIEKKFSSGRDYVVEVSWLWLVPAVFLWLMYGRNIRAKWFKRPPQ